MKTYQCPTDRELSGFDQGNLHESRYEEISLHLESCTECARRFETLESPADEMVEILRHQLRQEANAADSELRQLIDAAVALSNTSLTAGADTHSPKRILPRPSSEQLVQQILSPPQADGELGRLGGYRVLQILGIGGMGVVFRAEDPGLRRQVALKAVLPHEVDANDTSKERFLREARATASIQHDNIVTIHQVGQEGDVAFLAMQLLEGESLSKRLAREPRPPIEDVLRIAREIAQGLAAAHAKGLLHRDIKPENLWLEEASGEWSTGPKPSHVTHVALPRIKILDFGLARAADDRLDLTHSGAVVGTPSYLAPEQARGEKVDARADLFSLGVVMYEMLSGSRPFARNSLAATLLAIINDTPPSLSELRKDVPPALADLIARMLSKDPAQRPASANEVVRTIRSLETELKSEISDSKFSTPSKSVALPASRKTPPRQRKFIMVGAIALALLATIIVIIRTKDGKELARVTAPDGSTVETKTDEPTPPGVPDASTAALDFLPPISPIALTQRPAKLVAKEGEPVLSWTIATGPMPAAFTDYTQCAMRSDGKQFATFGEDGHVRIWDVDRKRLEKLLLGHAGGPAYSSLPNHPFGRAVGRRFGPLAWQPKSSLLASVSRDGTVKVWNVETGRTVFEHAGTAGDANMAAWSPDGSLLAVGCLQSMVRFWNTANWKELKSLDGLTGRTSSLVWSPDSSTLAVCTTGVALYSPRDAKLHFVEGTKHSDSYMGVPSLRWSPDGTQLAHLTSTSVVIRDAKSLERLRELRIADNKNAPPGDFAWSPDGRQLLVGWRAGNKGLHTIHDAATGEVARSLEIATVYNPLEQYVEWLPGNRTFVIQEKLVDLESQAVLVGSLSRSYDWSDDGERLLVLEGSTSVPRVLQFDKPSEKPTALFVPATTLTTSTWSPAWSPDGMYIKLGHGSYQRMMVACDRLGVFKRFLVPKQDFFSWSPNGAQTYGNPGSLTSVIHTWPTGELVKELKLPFTPGPHAWSADSSRIAVSHNNGNAIVIASMVTGEILATWSVPFGVLGIQLPSLDWDGDRIAVAAYSARGTAAYVYSAVGTLVHTLEGGGKGAYVRFVPGGKRVLRLSNDATFHYDAVDGRLVREIPIGVNRDAIHFVDDATVLCASPDGTVNRVNLRTGASEVLSRYAGEAQKFSPDGRFLICDLANVRRIVRVADGEAAVLITGFQALVNAEGHFLTSQAVRGAAWAAAPEIKDNFVYIVQTASGQETLTPAEFANRYDWQNDPSQVRLK